ncbi:MAG: Calx-beta domain-containing protein, partial [Verrucomicrobiota bacterium]
IPFAFQVVVAANETFAKMFDVTIPAGRTSVVSRLPLAQINGEIRLSLQLSANPLVELAEPMNARVLPAGANAQTQIIAASSRTEDERIVFDLPRYGPFSGPLQVRYATRDGTAIAGRDYEAASGVVTLGEATSGWAAIASVVVRRLGASPPEDREFYLDLDVPPNVVVSGSLVGRLAGQVPWTGFKIDGPNEVGEEAEFVEVKIVDENKDATFDVLTSDGTARAGVDYTAVHTTLRADGTLRVALVPNDARVEPVKIFKVTAVRASDRLTNSIDIVIVDDERGGARDETFLPIRYEGENYEVNTFGGVTGDDRIILCEASRAIWEYDRTGHFTARRPLPALPGTFKTGLVLPDGRLLVGTAGDALGQPSVFRLLPDGEFDPSFAGAVDQSTVLGLADGGAGRTVLLKRPFLENRWEIVRLLEDGAPDPAFPPIQSEPNNYEEGVARFGIQPDGAILAALSTCDWRWGCSYNRLVRIQDGTAVTLDQVVSSGFFAPPDIRARWFPHALPGGGTFLENIYPYGDVAFGYCVKPDGTLDENFTPGGTDAYLFQYLGVQSDGGIVGWSQPGVEVIRLHPGQTPRRGIILQAPGPAFYTEGTSGQMTLSRAGESSQPLEFRLKIKAGTAGPEDFANLSQVLRFAPLQNTVVLKITPLADGNVEGDEWADVGVEPLSEDVAIFGDDIRVQVSDSDPFVKLELTWEPALIGYSNQQDIFILDASDDGGRTWKPVEAVRGSFRREIDTGQPHRIYRARRNQ